MLNTKKSRIIGFTFFVLFLLISVNSINIFYEINASPSQTSMIATNNDTTTAVSSNQTELVLTMKYQLDDGLGAMNDIMVQGDLAYVTANWGGLIIFDISDLENPVELGSYYEPIGDTITTTDLTSGVFVRDNIVFLADGLNGLVILNVSNPHTPIKMGQYKKYAHQVFVEGNLAYVISLSETLIIYNISDLNNPIKISEQWFKGSSFHQIYVKNSLVFLDGKSGFINKTSGYVINATNPTDLDVIFTLNYTRIINIQNEFLFTVDELNRLVIYNLTILPNLTVVANYTITNN